MKRIPADELEVDMEALKYTRGMCLCFDLFGVITHYVVIDAEELRSHPRETTYNHPVSSSDHFGAIYTGFEFPDEDV